MKQILHYIIFSINLINIIYLSMEFQMNIKNIFIQFLNDNYNDYCSDNGNISFNEWLNTELDDPYGGNECYNIYILT